MVSASILIGTSVGRAELPLCPEFLGGAAAPPYRSHEDVCPHPVSQEIEFRLDGVSPYHPRLTPLLIHEMGCVSGKPLAAAAISFSNSSFRSSAGLKAWPAASPLHLQASCKSTTVPRP